MRTPRIKTLPSEADACYHCITRTVNGEHLLDDTALEVLRGQVWQVAEYCGLQVLTYALLANHLHVLIYVPKTVPISDAELLRRYGVLHPRPTARQTARLEVIASYLASNHPEAEAWRRRQQAMMGDISPFMQLLKQRFSIWYNKSHRRFGTLWAERFKSVLVEGKANVLWTMASYIDLNSVRKSLVADPKDYRFCGYAEAVAGNLNAQRGIAQVIGETVWAKAQSAYRQLLFTRGAEARDQQGSISPEDFKRAMAEGGKLPLADVLRCRIRYFSNGAVLGSKAFVEAQLARYRLRTGRRQNAGPLLLPAVTDWGDLAVLRNVRGSAFG